MITHDFPRDNSGAINASYDDTYISCQSGNQIYHVGGSILEAYIPSLQRGRRILKELTEEEIDTFDIEENDKEVLFKFSVKDVDVVASKLKAKTFGAGISPFSTKNFAKTNVSIPSEQIDVYKAITAQIPRSDVLCIHRITQEFLKAKLARRYKNIDVKSDMKKINLSRQVKEYIYVKGMWEEYIEYLRKELKTGGWL